MNKIIGSTDVILDNDGSRERETKIGNFLTDSFLYEVKVHAFEQLIIAFLFFSNTDLPNINTCFTYIQVPR